MATHDASNSNSSYTCACASRVSNLFAGCNALKSLILAQFANVSKSKKIYKVSANWLSVLKFIFSASFLRLCWVTEALEGRPTTTFLPAGARASNSKLLCEGILLDEDQPWSSFSCKLVPPFSLRDLCAWDP